MRKVKYFVANSLDNFIARPDGAVDWLCNDGTDYGMSRFFNSIDSMLIGRKTYEVALQQGHDMASSAGEGCYIFSRTLKSPTKKKAKGGRIIPENAGDFVRRLKQEAGKDIWLMGGGELAASLFAEDLVDEISLNIHPVLLGAGVPLLPAIGRQIDLELIECKPHQNGCVQLSYRVKRKNKAEGAQ